TLSEWVAHYPNKSLRAYVRDLRLELLPVLEKWVQTDSRPMYSENENEQYFVKGGRHRRTKPIRQKWTDCERELVALLAAGPQDDIFFLIAKGKALFTGARIVMPSSFRELLAICEGKKVVPEKLSKTLNDLIEEFYPQSAA